MAAKQCPSCDTMIGESEKVCPKCGLDFEEFSDEALDKIQRANELIEKRKKNNQPPTPPTPEPEPRKKSVWDALKGRKTK